MAEEEEASGSARSDGAGKAGLDPENGSTQKGTRPVLLRDMAFSTVEKGVSDIVTCVLEHIAGGNLPSVNVLFEMSLRLTTEEEIPEEEYRSFADELREQFEKLAAETGE